MSDKKILKEIPVGKLKPGMFVVKMDISWLDNPFFSSSRKIKSTKDIALLEKAGARIVTIDPSKGIDITDDQHTIDTTADDKEAKEKTEPPSTTNGTAGQSLEHELNAAIHLRSKLKKAINELQNDIGAGKPISSEKITPLLEQTLESLERNNQALLNLAHISQRSQKIADHCFSTFCIALNIAQLCNCNESEIEALGIAALVHESGWAQIPLQLMGKRQSYSPQESRLIEKHPEIALKMLANSEIPELARRIVAEHHELGDGSGYPKKLNGDQIHPLSQLFSVVDRYDELVHQLNDKPGMLPTNALRTLYVNSEKGLYSQLYVGHLISLLGVYPISSAVRLSNGMKGIVREVSRDNHLLLTIEIFYDEKGKSVEPFYLELPSSQESPISIDTVLDPKNVREDPNQRLVLNI